jgi:hypothetical protein
MEHSVRATEPQRQLAQRGWELPQPHTARYRPSSRRTRRGPRPIVSGPGAGDGATVGGRPARLNVRSPFGLLAVRRAGEREHPSRRAIHAPARRCSSGSGSGCISAGEGCHSNRRLAAAGQVTLEIRKWGLAKGAQFLAEPKDQEAGSARSPALGCTRSRAGLAATACTGLAWPASQQAPGRDACG